MIARAVIGANFGDEGKGLITDYLCSFGGAVVVRFNGGAQAGHTVVDPEGPRHVFGHFGSGTFLNVPTFLSQFFICNPILFFNELEKLHKLGIEPQVFAHPDCLVTTFADMIINQRKEKKRGDKAHGSCGVGIHETIQRSQIPNLKITMSDLWNKSRTLESRIEEQCGKWAKYRTGEVINESKMADGFLRACAEMANRVHPAGIAQCKDPIFEGAQGLLLDQDRKEFWPHVTHSNTGMKNVRILCAQAKIDDVIPYYVSRTYFTRHGNGPLPGEVPSMSYPDDTNLSHQFQGNLRFAPMTDEGFNVMRARCAVDFNSHDYKLVLTHCDQVPPHAEADFYSEGPTRRDVNFASAYEAIHRKTA